MIPFKLIFFTISGLTWYSATFYFSDFQPPDLFTPEPGIQHFRRHFGDKTLNNSTPKSELVLPVHNTVNSSYTEDSYTQKVTSSDLLSRTLEQRTEDLVSKTTSGNVVHSSEKLTSDGITISQSTLGKSTSDKSASEESNTEKSGSEKSTVVQDTKMDLKQDRLSALENPAIKKILYFNKVSQKRDIFLRIFMPFCCFSHLDGCMTFYMYYYKNTKSNDNEFFLANFIKLTTSVYNICSPS
jgi:hypothetical protein